MVVSSSDSGSSGGNTSSSYGEIVNEVIVVSAVDRISSSDVKACA
jgi:hypothetical protein